MLVHGTVYTVGRVARQLKPVTCERCGQPFGYVLARLGIGKGSALYGIDKQGAQSRAAASAERDLADRMAKDAELVPCPACAWVNADAIAAYRSRLYRRTWPYTVTGILGGIFGGSLLEAWLMETYGYGSPWPRPVGKTVLVAGLLTPLWVRLVAHLLRRRVDPNATRPPAVPPGTPPALVERIDPATGGRVLVPLPDRPPATGRVDRAVLRPGQPYLPATCVVCLAPATATYRPPFRVDQGSDEPVPLCATCLGDRRRVWWRTFGGVTLLAAAVGVAFALIVPHPDPVVRWVSGGLIAAIGAVVAVGVAAKSARPYRSGWVDRRRGISYFASVNPAYTARLAEWTRAADREPVAVD